MTKKINIIIAVLFCSASLFGQDISKDFSATYNAYLSDNLSIDFQVTMYANKDDKKGTTIGKGLIRKEKNNYYSQYGDYEYVVNDKGTLMVNNAKKELSFYKGIIQKAPSFISSADMDTLLAEADSVVFKGIIGNKKLYSLFDESSGVMRTDMYIDIANGFISRIEYFYNENSDEEDYDAYKVVIDYSSISTSKNIDKGIFSLSKYVTSKNNSMVATNRFTNYKLQVISKQ
jgi:hypothetical protein